MCKNLNAAHKGYRGAFAPSNRQNAWNCALFYTKKQFDECGVVTLQQQYSFLSLLPDATWKNSPRKRPHSPSSLMTLVVYLQYLM